MVKILLFEQKHRNEVLDLIKHVHKHEFGLPIDSNRDKDLWDIKGHYHKRGGGFWVAKHQNKLVGTIGLHKHDDRIGLLRRMYVHPEHRRMGVGEKMLKHVILHAKNIGLAEIYLGTKEEMISANAFYTKHGFQLVPELPEGTETVFENTYYVLYL